ncbi:hypothetical protein ACEWY4_012417 [Coilia grayii]|uniref:Uncharacterized protein n=1 Tax=Coilia grayii TaxID=363190 RepID=A0ABD1K0G0_9TELE
MENLSVGRGVPRGVAVSGGALQPRKETVEERGIERAAANQLNQMPDLPLPDYETLFPKKRHGVMGQTRWDHIIAEVNQRRMNKAANRDETEVGAAGGDELKVAWAPTLASQSTAAPQETPSEVNDQKDVTSPKTSLLPPKPVLSGKSFGSSSKQAFLPPRPLMPDEVSSSSKQAVQLSKPVAPCQTVELAVEMTDHSPVNPSVEKPLKASNKLLFSALENARKRDSRFAKPQDLNRDERKLYELDPLKKKTLSTSIVLSDTSSIGVEKTQSGTQEVPLVNSRPQTRPKKPKKDSENEPSECASATSKEVVSDCDHPSTLNHCVSVENIQELCSNDEVFEVDPFPSDQFFSHDPWQLPEQSMSGEENHDHFKKIPLDPFFSNCSQNGFTGCSEPNKPIERVSKTVTPTPQISLKKRQAPLPPVTSGSLNTKDKSERHTEESSVEFESKVKTKGDVLGSRNSGIINEEQRNAEQLDMTSVTVVTATKTVFAETSSKRQVEMVVKPNCSQISVSVEKHPQATPTELVSVVENVQKCSTDVTKPSYCLENENNILNATVDVSDQPDDKPVPIAGIMLDTLLTDTDKLICHTNDMQTLKSRPTLPQLVETGCPPMEKDTCEAALRPATKSLAVKEMEVISNKKDRQTDCIEVEPVENLYNADVQKNTIFKCDPFCDDKNRGNDPWNIPEQNTHDCFFTADTKTKPPKIDHDSLTPDDFDIIFGSDKPTNEFSDSCSEKFLDQNKAVPVIDTGTPIAQSLQKKLDSSPLLSFSGIESSETSKSEPEIICQIAGNVVTRPSEELMNAEVMDTSLAPLSRSVIPIQPLVALPGEKYDESITPNHTETAKAAAEKTILQKEMEVIPIRNSQHGTLFQIVSSENVPEADKEDKIIKCDPFPHGRLLLDDSSNHLLCKKGDDTSAHHVSNDMKIEETDLPSNEFYRNCEPDISEVPLSTSSQVDLPFEQQTVEIGPEVILPPDILSKEDPLLNVSLGTSCKPKIDTPDTIPEVLNYKENADLWKVETSPSVINRSAKATFINALHRQQDEMPMTNLEQYLGENTNHVEKLESSYNIQETAELFALANAKDIEEPFGEETLGTSLCFSAPTTAKSDGPWDSDSSQSVVHHSTNQFSEIPPNGAARASQNKHDTPDEIGLFPEVPIVPIVKPRSMESKSKAEPDHIATVAFRDALRKRPGAENLDTILEEDIRHKDTERLWGTDNFSTSFSLPISSPSGMSTTETLGAGSEKPSPLHRLPVYARISPLEVQAVGHHHNVSQLAPAAIR